MAESESGMLMRQQQQQQHYRQDEAPSSSSRHSRPSRPALAVAAASIFAAVVVVILVSDETSRQQASTTMAQLMETLSSSVTSGGMKATTKGSRGSSSYGAALKTGTVWTTTRTGYTPLPFFLNGGLESSDKRKYSFLADFDGIVEPNVPTELYVDGYNANSDDKYYYTFKVCTIGEGKKTACQSGKLNSHGSKTTSDTITKDCSPYDIMSVTIFKYSKNGNKKKGKTTGSLMCMYVRREIRALSTDDLSATMDAMYNIYSTAEEDGQADYGSNWHNSTYFIKAHHFNAAQMDGDHIHEGLGFLPQHIKMTNIFESAMQAVDPSVTMPYWDFTMEKYETGGTPVGSFMFSEDTFGSLSLPADETFGYTYAGNSVADAKIPDGRFAKLKTDYLETIPTGYENIVKNFGYLRAPWNINPSPYVSRFTNYEAALPECADHYDFISDSDDTLQTFLQVAPYAPHARIHGSIGSVYGCDLMTPMREAGLVESQAKQILLCTQWPIVIKVLYRKNLIVGADAGSCVEKKKSDDYVCALQCNDDGSGDFESTLDVLLNKYTGSLTTSQWSEWKDFVCGDGSKIFAGDHLESASPGDPSFWPVHPTLERLLQAKYMLGGFSSEYWPTEQTSSDSTNYLCDRWTCYESEQSVPWGVYTQCCDGHHETDGLLDFTTGDRFALTGPTNKETLDATNPTLSSYSMPYIYDSFEWDHCDDSDFESLFA